MRVVVWLFAIFTGSILLGVCSLVAPGYLTIEEHYEGLLGIPIFVAMIASLSSGFLLPFVIGPAVLEDRIKRNRASANSKMKAGQQSNS